MSLLVTGGAGFIGGHFVRRRRRLFPDEPLVVLDALTYAGQKASLDAVLGDPRVAFVRGDVCDGPLLSRVLAEHAIESIVHFAAETHVDRSIFDPLVFTRSNVLGTATLLEHARRAKVARFVHVSTDEVYGDLGPTDPAFTERSPIAPRSPYAASKAGADHVVRAYVETYGFPAIITRASNNYGPFQLPEKLIPRLTMCALENRPLPIFGDGMNVRDWLHVDDHCGALDLVLSRGRDGEIYNVGGRCERPNLTIAKAILSALGKPESLLQFVADRAGHDRRYALDDSKIEDELGFRRTRLLAEALPETVLWYRDHRAFVEATRGTELADLQKRGGSA